MGDSDETSALSAAAALENLLVVTYAAIAGLPVVVDGPARLRQLAVTYRGHHADHAMAVNAALVAAGGTAQAQPDPAYLATVRAAEPGLTTVPAVARLLAQIERAAGSAYVRGVAVAPSSELRSLLLSIAVVEGQHAATLALAADGVGLENGPGPDLVTLPTALATAAVPGAFFPNRAVVVR